MRNVGFFTQGTETGWPGKHRAVPPTSMAGRMHQRAARRAAKTFSLPAKTVAFAGDPCRTEPRAAQKGRRRGKAVGGDGRCPLGSRQPWFGEKAKRNSPGRPYLHGAAGLFWLFIWGQTRRLYQRAGGRDVYASSGKAGAAPAPTRKMPADMPLVTAFRAAAAFINTYKSPRRRTCPVCPRRYIFSASFPCP